LVDLKGDEEYLSDKGITPVDASQAEAVAANDFIETSALTQKNLTQVFDTAILAVMNNR